MKPLRYESRDYISYVVMCYLESPLFSELWESEKVLI